MSQAEISDEINRHFEAVVVLSKRDMLLRILREAELCMEVEQPNVAAILAGVALDEVYLMKSSRLPLEDEQKLQVWRELRNLTSHPGAQAVDPKIVTTVLAGIRSLLSQVNAPPNRNVLSPDGEDELTKVRGKYAFVRTSVDEFLKRKREESELEDLRR